MYFTQEDYKKIEGWLKRNSVKDTEFPEAMDLNGNEVLVITQEGENRKLYIRDLLIAITQLQIPSIINVTTTYNAPNILLEEAIKAVPFKSRRIGQIITFSTPENTWETYQFIGALNQWNNTNTWNKLF